MLQTVGGLIKKGNQEGEASMSIDWKCLTALHLTVDKKDHQHEVLGFLMWTKSDKGRCFFPVNLFQCCLCSSADSVFHIIT